jgi:Uncharacterised protein family UPF0547
MRAEHHLEKARALLDEQPEQALTHAWRAATVAAQRRDDAALRSAAELGRDVRGRLSGKDERHAGQLVRYCEEAVEDNLLRRQGFLPRSWSLSWTRTRTELKKCPDCAETILRDANVCRFCGYRFAEAPQA